MAAVKEQLSVEDINALIDFCAETTHDPLKFVQLAYPWGEPGTALEDETGPDTWQSDLLQRLGERLKEGASAEAAVSNVIREAVASGHGIGKSALVAWIVDWAMATCEDTRGIVTANTDTQLKSKTWAELNKWHNMCICKPLFELTATRMFSSQRDHESLWRIDAIPWSKSNPDAFAGLHNKNRRILIIFDEASSIDDVIWEVIDGATTDANTEILWLAFGNPTRNTGRFYDCFHRFKRMWGTRHIDSRTCKQTNKALLQELIDGYGGDEDNDVIRVRIRGLFPRASDTQFISLALVEDAMERKARQEQYEQLPTVIGVDPAYDGGDKIAIMLRQGIYCKLLAEYPKNDNDGVLARSIAEFEDQYNAAAVFIDKGYGTGVYSFGQVMGRNKWVLVSFGSTDDGATQRNGYLNKRAEMWAAMREWLKNGGCLPHDDEQLRDELIAPMGWVNEKGLIQLEPKALMKKRGLASPNRADALALTFAYPVQIGNPTKQRYEMARRSGRIRKAGCM